VKITKPVENWTKFPNCILDNIEKYSGNELKILALMVRKNIGFSNPNKMFSLTYISDKTGISRPTVITSITSLLEKKSIIEIETGKNKAKRYDINWTEPVVKEFNQLNNLTSTSKEILPPLVKNFNTVLETTSKKIKKETINKKKKKKRLKFDYENKISFYDFVWITQNEYEKLIEEYGKAIITEYISRLDFYMTNRDDKRPDGANRYLDHNKVIRAWLNKANIPKKDSGKDPYIEQRNIELALYRSSK